MTEFCRGSRDYRHDWTDWSMFVPEPIEWVDPTYLANGAVPEHVSINAKRERLCRNCRGVQREDHGTGKRVILYPGHDGF